MKQPPHDGIHGYFKWNSHHMTKYTFTSNKTTTTWRITQLLQMKQPPHDGIHSYLKWNSHHMTKYTVASNSHIQSAPLGLPCWLSKYKLDIPLIYIYIYIYIYMYKLIITSEYFNFYCFVIVIIFINYINSRTTVKIHKTPTSASYGPLLHY
jgi:hypothetical protein